MMPAACRLVGHSDDGCHMKTIVNKSLEALNRKIGSAEKHNLQVFFLHL